MIINKAVNGRYKDEYFDLVDDSVNIINLQIPIRKTHFPKIIWKAKKTIEKVEPDIVMSTMLKSNIFFTMILMLCRGHYNCVLRESNNHSIEKHCALKKRFIKYMYSTYAKRCIALSEGVKKDLVDNFYVDQDNIDVIFNPINIKQINAMQQEPSIKLETKAKKIVAVGRLVAQKDYPTLLKAMSVLRSKINCKLYILGEGILENQLKEDIQHYGLEHHVELLGFQKNPYYIMAQADIFVLSSAWEGFGHVIVEAMAVGIPVVSTNCDFGPGEIITNGVNGILVEVGDYKAMAEQMYQILCDKEKAANIVNAAHLRAKDFDVRVIVKQYEKLFIQLCHETS